MQFFIIVLVICLVLFLFRLYHLANDDYMLIKRNITLEEVFNLAIISSLISLGFARVFYIVFHPEPVFFNPLGFLLFPYFPGLSMTGGIFGGILSLLAYVRFKKFPAGRIFDFYTVSLIFVLPVGLIGYFLLSKDITIGNTVKLAMYVIILIFSNIYLYPKARALEIKDGTLSVLFLIFFSLISLLGSAVDNPGIKYFLSHRENLVLIIILIASIGLLLKLELIGRAFIRNGK